MADTVVVTPILDVVTVVDPTTSVPVNITEEVISVGSVGSGAEQINIVVVEDALNVAEELSAVIVSDDPLTVQPQLGEVLIQVVEDSEMPYAKRTDFASETIIYKGEAVVGTLEAAASWRVRRLTIATDSDVTEEWAAGNASFNKIWDNRASLVYS